MGLQDARWDIWYNPSSLPCLLPGHVKKNPEGDTQEVALFAQLAPFQAKELWSYPRLLDNCLGWIQQSDIIDKKMRSKPEVTILETVPQIHFEIRSMKITNTIGIKVQPWQDSMPTNGSSTWLLHYGALSAFVLVTSTGQAANLNWDKMISSCGSSRLSKCYQTGWIKFWYWNKIFHRGCDTERNVSTISHPLLSKRKLMGKLLFWAL